jgi:hypothetical protein
VRRSKPTPDVKVDRSRILEPLRAQGGDDLVPDARRSLLADVTSLDPAGVGVLFYLDAFVRTRPGSAGPVHARWRCRRNDHRRGP